MDMNDTREDGKWGDEIPILDGVKPQWLSDSTPMQWRQIMDTCWYGDGDSVSLYFVNGRCNGVDYIRLPADHSHYKQAPVRTTDEQLTHYAERMENLVRRVAACTLVDQMLVEEARAIVASMVEPDVLIARQVCGETLNEVEDFMSGGCDAGEIMQCAVAAIRRGRALERGE